jgi:hypothetical protein
MLERPSLALGLSLGGLWLSACTIKTPEDLKPAPAPAGESGTSPTVDGQGGDASQSSGAGGVSGRLSTGHGGTKPIISGGTAGIAGAAGAAGQSGEEDCSRSCDSGACVDGACVECVPDNDRCEIGKYCSADYHCEPGCKGASSCASGVCGADHSCERCIEDGECADGSLCSSGTCTRACSAADEGTSTGCRDSLTCCSIHCADLATDSKNCGACGNACQTGQFCGLADCEGNSCSACHDTTLANVCSVAKVVVILDTNKNTEDGDRAPGQAIGNALAEQCPTEPELTETMQNSAEALNLTTGRPVSNSSELLVIAGGPFFQDLEGYLEEQKVSPLYWSGETDSTGYRLRATGELVVSMPIAEDHETSDAFIIQFMRDPDSGSLVLNAQGLWLSGTVAAAYQLTNGLLPTLSEQDQAWYAYRWTDQDGDKAPDADEIVLVDSGS